MTQIDNIYGTDLIYQQDTGFYVGPNGDYAEINGIQNLTNWIYRCLITGKGEFRLRPTYGCGVLDYVKRKATSDNLRALKQDIISNLLLDPRISNIDVSINNSSLNGNNIIMVIINVVVSGNQISIPPFSFSN